MMSQAAGLIFWMAVTFAAAATGGIASGESAGFYRELILPSWAPPGWLFGPVWSLLYIMMGLSAWLVWRERKTKKVSGALLLYTVHLGFNAIWTWIFFVWRQGMWAFAEILILWLMIAALIKSFRCIKPLAAWLLIPYLGWVSFAALLALTIWRMNPALLG